MTPPEFRGLTLAPNESGRVGGVRLELIAANGFTKLGACYQQVPLRVLPPFQFDAARPALLYLLNPTAGLFDGDGQLAEIVVRAGANALIVGQSATRIHPTLNSFSTQQWKIRVEAGATAIVLPGPAIPFRNCRSFQRVAVDLADGASFCWGDIWTAGRYARGADSECYQFTSLIQELVIRRGGRLVFRDRCHWRGPWDTAAATWHCQGAAAWGSLFVTGPLDEQSVMLTPGTALFRTEAGDTCLRRLGTVQDVIETIVGMALRIPALGTERTEAAGVLFHDFAPVHWFNAGSFTVGVESKM